MTPGEVARRIRVETAKVSDAARIRLDEKTFRGRHEEDAAAAEELSEGIRKLYAYAHKLK